MIAGYSNKINQAGIQYYQKLIEELKSNNIEPVVTLFHWDLPQTLQDIGGWPNANIIELFTEYARICFQYFGHSVKYWMTFNEPKQICHWGYGIAALAPFIKSPHAEYLCAHNLILSHSNTWRLYNEFFRKSQGGW